MHRAAQVQADIAIVGLDYTIKSEVDAFAVAERPAAALDASVERVDSPDGCGDGTILDVDSGDVIASTTGMDGFRGAPHHR